MCCGYSSSSVCSLAPLAQDLGILRPTMPTCSFGSLVSDRLRKLFLSEFFGSREVGSPSPARLGYANKRTPLSVFSHSHVEARMCVEIVVNDVIGALCRLRPHGRRSACALEGEPRQPTNVPPPSTVVIPGRIVVPAVVPLAVSVACFVD